MVGGEVDHGSMTFVGSRPRGHADGINFNASKEMDLLGIIYL